MTLPDKKTPQDDPPPPIGRSWKILYSVVIANLIVLILIFYGFTRAFG